jgi:phenylpropionate dioxygenase-like ring-hydroxylating dioxygenase large terminal subunit
MSASVATVAPSGPVDGTRRPAPWHLMPNEGDGGVFTQSWYGMTHSEDLKKGQVLGCDFLDGRIVLFRGEDGKPRAMSAYCPHVGADLSLGAVIGNNIRCAFHHWEYDSSGVCVKTGVGDPPPREACLFNFPCKEHLGIIWVFNGEKPLFDLPTFPYPEDEIEIARPYDPVALNCDPWVFCANTPDMQHLKFVHNMTIDGEDPHDKFTWDPFGFEYRYTGTEPGGVHVDTTLSIRGTSIFYRSQMYGDFWRGSLTGFGMPRPGKLVAYAINAVRKGPKAKEELAIASKVSQRILSEDRDIMNTVRYRYGLLTKGDTSLSKFLRYVRNYPRAHPSANFIR